MARKGTEFPWGKLAAVAALLGLTVLPVVSCGPLEFKGHELLRNEPPDVAGLTSGLTSGLRDLGRSLQDGAPDEDSRDTTAVPPADGGSAGGLAARGAVFAGSERWMHWLYVAVVGLTVLCLLLPAASRLAAGAAALGIAGLVVFLSRFQDALVGDDKEAPAAMSVSLFEWDAGAYLAVFGLALVVLSGLRAAPDGAVSD